MQTERAQAGSASRWGPLFGARAHDWAETWEGPSGWGTPVYEHVLDRAEVGPGSTVLECGCGAGRFARMAADRGAEVAGIDASDELIDVAAGRTPEGDFRVGNLEALPWETGSFDLVTGFSAFQFADDKVRALSEAGRVSRDLTAVIIPTRAASSGIAAVFKLLLPLFPPDALEGMKHSGMFALSEPGRLDEALADAPMAVVQDGRNRVPRRVRQRRLRRTRFRRRRTDGSGDRPFGRRSGRRSCASVVATLHRLRRPRLASGVVPGRPRSR